MSFARRAEHHSGVLARKRIEVEGDERRRGVGVRPGEGEELVDQVRGAVGARNDLPHRVLDIQRVSLPHRELGLHLKSENRRIGGRQVDRQQAVPVGELLRDNHRQLRVAVAKPLQDLEAGKLRQPDIEDQQVELTRAERGIGGRAVLHAVDRDYA